MTNRNFRRYSFSLKVCSKCLVIFSGQITYAQVTKTQGQTESGAFNTIALPDGRQARDGLDIWNHCHTQKDPKPNPSLRLLESIVLGQGFALAASSFNQTGWAVFSSHIDNQQLYEKFVEIYQTPEKFYIQGTSMGGIVSLRDLEADLIPNLSGALLMSGAVGGADN
jgi:uncharacterized membrane protein